MTKALVIQFRRGRKNYKPRHFLLEISGCDSKEKAEKFKGKTVEWKSPGQEPKIIKGKIAAPHGTKGVLRAIFEKGLPGQALCTEVEVGK